MWDSDGSHTLFCGSTALLQYQTRPVSPLVSRIRETVHPPRLLET